jgi:hypothetical protein
MNRGIARLSQDGLFLYLPWGMPMSKGKLNVEIMDTGVGKLAQTEH